MGPSTALVRRIGQGTSEPSDAKRLMTMLPSSIAGVPSIAGGIGITNLVLVSVTGRGSIFIGQS